MGDLATDMARGPLRLRLSRGWDTVVLVLAMVVMAMAVLDTATERGLPMLRPSPRPMPGTDMVAFMATESQPTVVMDMVLAMVMERGPLMLSLRLMPGMDMVAFTAMDSQFMVATAMD